MEVPSPLLRQLRELLDYDLPPRVDADKDERGFCAEDREWDELAMRFFGEGGERVADIRAMINRAALAVTYLPLGNFSALKKSLSSIQQEKTRKLIAWLIVSRLVDQPRVEGRKAVHIVDLETEKELILAELGKRVYDVERLEGIELARALMDEELDLVPVRYEKLVQVDTGAISCAHTNSISK
jgi:hypothetical protein